MLATKKVGSNVKNGRDSIGRRLGLKVGNLQRVNPGNILVRQRGQKYKLGLNTYYGRDHSIHSKISGIVKFTSSLYGTFVNVCSNLTY